MSTVANRRNIEVIPMALRQYSANFNPWTDRPREVHFGTITPKYRVHAGVEAFKLCVDQTYQIHLVDYVYRSKRRNHRIKGVRIYGEHGKYLMSFPDLTLFGDSLAVATTHQLLRAVGMNNDDIAQMYRAACNPIQRRQGTGSLEEYDYILIAILKDSE